MTGDSSKTGLIQNERSTATSSSSDLKCEVECRLYSGRYYVLMVLAFLSVSQNIAWMTFGPIPTESNEHFGLSDDEITILAGEDGRSQLTIILLTVYPAVLKTVAVHHVNVICLLNE